MPISKEWRLFKHCLHSLRKDTIWRFDGVNFHFFSSMNCWSLETFSSSLLIFVLESIGGLKLQIFSVSFSVRFKKASHSFISQSILGLLGPLICHTYSQSSWAIFRKRRMCILCFFVAKCWWTTSMGLGVHFKCFCIMTWEFLLSSCEHDWS